MQYRKEQFDKLIHNPFGEEPEETEVSVSFGRLQHALNGILECKPKKDIGRLSQYILYLYDKNTPLISYEPDIDKRKRTAATLAGYDLEKDKNRLEKIFFLSDTNISQVVMNFIRFQRSREWSSLVTNEQLFWELQDGIINRYDDFKDDEQVLKGFERKTMLSKKSDQIVELISKYEEALFNGDEELKEIAASSRSGATPELFASQNV